MLPSKVEPILHIPQNQIVKHTWLLSAYCLLSSCSLPVVKGAMHHICKCYEVIQVLNDNIHKILRFDIKPIQVLKYDVI